MDANANAIGVRLRLPFRFIQIQHSQSDVNVNVNSEENANVNVSLLSVRSRLFSVLFVRLAIVYANFVSPFYRKAIEYSILALALISFAIWTHLHITFIRNPVNCLREEDNIVGENAILRVQIKSSHYDFDYDYDFIDDYINVNVNDDIYDRNHVKYGNVSQDKDIGEEDNNIDDEVNAIWPHNAYVVEYSLEYGLLRLSNAARRRLRIAVRVVTLDPNADKCFGDSFSRLLLKYVLGYDDVLMRSLKSLAERQQHRGKGFVRNVITNEQFRFVDYWMTRASYVSSGFVMVVFTLSISMLLRYSHHQVFVFVAELMQMLDNNRHHLLPSYASFPAAPLLTVILALVGMEAIMSEFFNDTTTAFYVILLVWTADQFDSICSHSPLTRRHWLKFFYLYQFVFYSYSYRFNGQYSGIALLTCALMTQHAMIAFFHRYELPSIVNASVNVNVVNVNTRSASDDQEVQQQQQRERER